MRIRFGFVSHVLTLWELKPSRTLTFKRYKELSKLEREQKLIDLTRANIHQTKRAIHFTIAAEIPLYRMSSSIVPLASHPEAGWDFVTPLRDEWQALGQLVKEGSMRVSFHPGQFTLFTSDQAHIIDNSIRDMNFHYQMLEAMGLEKEAFINIHIGGAYGDKARALERFHENIKKMPPEVMKRMTIENDDRTYTALETLEAAEKADIPIVFDYHHEQANQSDVDYPSLLERIFKTWDKTGIPPKVHLSTPKNDKQFRSHADFIDLEFTLPFLKACKEHIDELDVMIEAKSKDQALLRLVEELSSMRGVKRLAGGVIEF